MLTDQQRIDVRRFCGYPVYGGGPTQAFRQRFFTWYGTLEFRISNLGPNEEGVLVSNYLSNLYPLEQAIAGAGVNLDTQEAAVWKHNPRELDDRIRLYDWWRRALCDFLGVPPGPNFHAAGAGVQVVV
ncbi:MAG: hypothetical protein JO142_09000 [Burkholderiales bacterium]|nr:hypothetical protein [Burkholderiales bacterium]